MYVCYKYLTTPHRLETSRLNIPVILNQPPFPAVQTQVTTTLCCRKPQGAWPDGAAAGTATSPREASGHRLLLSQGEHTVLSPAGHPWPMLVAAPRGAMVAGSREVPTALALALPLTGLAAALLPPAPSF